LTGTVNNAFIKIVAVIEIQGLALERKLWCSKTIHLKNTMLRANTSWWPTSSQSVSNKTNTVTGLIIGTLLLVMAALPIILASLPPTKIEITSNRQEVMRQFGYQVPAQTDSLDKTVGWYLRH
jgi:hypothetical protein